MTTPTPSRGPLRWFAGSGRRAVLVASSRTWAWPALSGLLLGLAFPTDPEFAVAFAFTSAWAWVALVPLLAVLYGLARASDSPGGSSRGCLAQAFRRGWVAGGIFTLVTMYWVAGTQGGGPAVVGGTLLMAIYLGLFGGAFAAAQTLVFRSIGAAGALAAPALWTAVEYLLSLGELGFPWLLLGHSQAAQVTLVQYAEYTGAYGVSFCIVLVNGLLFLAVASPWERRRRGLAAVAAAAALLGPALWGQSVLPDSGTRPNGAAAEGPGAPGPVVGLIQNNLGLEKWQSGGFHLAVSSLSRLSREAADQGADLLLWPETAMPCRVATDPYCRKPVQSVAHELDVAVLTGGPHTDLVTGEPYNSAFLVQPASAAPIGPERRDTGLTWPDLQMYSKMHLVPFGERTPFRDSIPLLGSIDWSALTGDLGSAEFSPGKRRTLFRYRGGRFAALICFESVFPDLVRRNVLGPAIAAPDDGEVDEAGSGADFLVIITNDSWFGATAGPYQHAAISALRAVENRISIARCATSGISLFIDPFGRTSHHTPLYEEAVRVASLAPRAGRTVYTERGDLFAGSALLASLAMIGWCLFRRPGPPEHA